jgi:hypothetical protein
MFSRPESSSSPMTDSQIEVRLCLGVVREENGVRKDWVREHLFNIGNPELILGLVPFAQALLGVKHPAFPVLLAVPEGKFGRLTRRARDFHFQ